VAENALYPVTPDAPVMTNLPMATKTFLKTNSCSTMKTLVKAAQQFLAQVEALARADAPVTKVPLPKALASNASNLHRC